MGKKQSDRSNDDLAGAESPSDTESNSDIPDFTPEQWEWVKEETRPLEKDYVPTRTLIPGL